ncbi:MAG: hypothetical protein JXA22_04190 [Candidatus Thermoplasmatota archaeon]|nr:hypothetical protein [Candidatus Thermoplasmatota archaeon]
MTELSSDVFPPDDVVFRLRAKMEDYSYTITSEGGVRFLAFRVPGENIDLLRSLEYLSEFLEVGSTAGVEKVLMVSDREFEVSPGSIIGPKMEMRKTDDDKLFQELREKLKERMPPLVFTTENDMLELYRIAIKIEGSVSRSDSSIGLDLLKISLPSEGDVIYLIFDDGYRKLSRTAFEKLAEGAMLEFREGPSIARDPAQKGMARSTVLQGARSLDGVTGSGDKERIGQGQGSDINARQTLMEDPRVMLRELSKNLGSLGYRRDNVFSRPDVNQLFFVGMSGPALFIKVMEEEDDQESFLRVLEHRKDALGILITKVWEPKLEALSRMHGFVYLDWQRAWRTHEVVREVLKGGGS